MKTTKLDYNLRTILCCRYLLRKIIKNFRYLKNNMSINQSFDIMCGLMGLDKFYGIILCIYYNNSV